MSDPVFPEVLRQDAQLHAFLKADSYWTDVYLSDGLHEGQTLQAVLTPPDQRSEVLACHEWEGGVANGVPGFVLGRSGIEYHRHLNYLRGALPIVYVHKNEGNGPVMLPELSEELRHLMEFRPNLGHTRFFRRIRDGSYQPAARVTETNVRIRTKFLRQYQAARQLDLVRYIHSIVFYPGDHTEAFNQLYRGSPHEILGPGHRLELSCEHCAQWDLGDMTLSVLHGKLVIPAPPQERAAKWLWEQEEDSQDPNHRVEMYESVRPLAVAFEIGN
ncbi:MAG: hypothetical protein F4091_01960 [Acidimicrobiales bacterium]|nr:hypothetical protein [Acidimicrobiales bacterium]MYD82177.1 hypothetical protein [Acidimicrobiales bacterium]MYJ64218.1 hypothetical protein [Acidimicrobiales bacterium]